MHDPGQCKCFRCTYGPEAYEAMVKNALKTFGWYVEGWPEDYDYPNHHNYHTHGLLENFKHPDLQICFPMNGEMAHDIFSACLREINAGAKFEPGTKYPNILGNGYLAQFIFATEGGRPVLRLVLPDPWHRYDGPMYASQFLTTTPEQSK